MAVKKNLSRHFTIFRPQNGHIGREFTGNETFGIVTVFRDKRCHAAIRFTDLYSSPMRCCTPQGRVMGRGKNTLALVELPSSPRFYFLASMLLCPRETLLFSEWRTSSCPFDPFAILHEAPEIVNRPTFNSNNELHRLYNFKDFLFC